MQPTPAVYVPGTSEPPALPLARFLPLLPPGALESWLGRTLEPGAFVIDPLNATPALALEAARAGYRVVVASNNPILTFMLEVLASAPSQAELTAALAELASARRGDERLELHLKALYQTSCPNCNENVQAEAYLWRRGESAPYARVVRCPACRSEGEFPLDDGDLARLTLPGNNALHRARALSRVALPEETHFEAVQEALGAYLDRPLYALTTLINKTEGQNLPEARRKLLLALLISACDAASALQPHPGSGRARPRQLGVPAQFRELNLWLAVEEAVNVWSSRGPAVPLVRWPELPPPGGISLFAGRARGLLPLPEELRPVGLAACFPRPSQAFWALSAMWSGWLWGRESALPLHSLLERRRFDWAWHASAMQGALSALGRALPGAPLVGVLSELAPGFLAAILAAADSGGFRLQSLALREDDEQVQALWKSEAVPLPSPSEEQAGLLFENALREALEERAEPAGYLPLYTAGLAGLARGGGLLSASARSNSTGPGAAPAGEALTRLQGITGRVFANRRLLKRFTGASQEDERSLWWLVDPPADLEEPLADRVERETVRLLQRSPGLPRLELETTLCQSFPGLLTPSGELVQAALESYAEEVPGQPGRWRLLPQEAPALRRADLEENRRLLKELGERMNFAVSGETPLLWTPRAFGPVYFFYPMASSLVSRYVLGNPPAPVRQCVMVFPGSRARLLSFKLRRDPRLAELLQGWHLLKFRHLRDLAERPNLTPEVWEELLDADPPFFEEAEQMRLL